VQPNAQPAAFETGVPGDKHAAAFPEFGTDHV
jgi:hypothetical protein